MGEELAFVNSDIDDVDRNIINVILDDSKLSVLEIGKKVGVSGVTVMKRINSLINKSIIKNFTVNPDYEKLGFDVNVIIEMRISKGKLFEVENKIAKHPSVFAVYDVTGSFDTLIIAKFKSRRSMDSFLKKLQTYDFVERTETKLILNMIKEENVKV